MKRLFGLNVLLITLFLATQAFAGNPYGFYYNEYVKPTDTLNVRSGAGTSYSVVGTVVAGNAGKVIGGPTYNNGYQWWYIDWPVQGITGWSAQNWLTLFNERDEENYSTGYVEVDGTDGVSLKTRFTAGVDEDVLGSYSEGTVGEIVDGPIHRHAYVWWRVSWPDNTIGWSVQRYLKETSAPPAQDTTPPVITVLGDHVMEISYDSNYSDAGATATDNVDGDITQDIQVTGLPIDTTIVGAHYIWYNVSDSAGNNAQEKARMVTVLEQGSAPVEGSAVVFGNTIGSGWSYDKWNVTTTENDGYLNVSFDAQLGELRFSTELFDTTGYNTLSFYIKSSNPNEQLYVHLHDADGNFSWDYHVYIPKYMYGGTLYTQTWNEVNIPLGDLGGENTTITGVTFTDDDVSNIAIDELRFTTFTKDTEGGCNEN